MSLDEYGVLRGQFTRFERDDPDNAGTYYHGMVFVRAPDPSGKEIEYRCAVDVNAHSGPIHYLKLKIENDDLGAILALAPGYHELARTSTSGALDYQRSPFIGTPIGCAMIFNALWAWLTRGEPRAVWTATNGNDALTALETTLAGATDILIFGEPFLNTPSGERGMHNVHLNQGNHPPTPGAPNYNQQNGWYLANGIWQDGAVLVPRAEHTDAYLVRFDVQDLPTDDNGNPV